MIRLRIHRWPWAAIIVNGVMVLILMCATAYVHGLYLDHERMMKSVRST